MPRIKFLKSHENFKGFVKGSKDSACYDCSIASIEVYADVIVCNLGFKTEIPKHWKGVIVPRSNLTKHNYAMLNSPGQIDADYRGDWMVKFTKIKNIDSTFPYKVGDRCCQISFEKVREVTFIEVDKIDGLEDSDRGVGGFGSTGKN